MPNQTSPFDAADYLRTPEDIKGFLQEAAKGSADEFIHAINTAARAQGMADIAQQAGVSRASLYKSLGTGGNPNYKTIDRIMHAMGLKLSVQSL